MSWKAEVIADDSGKWVANALRFATKEEAEGYARDLFARWTSVREWRAVESDEPVNRTWELPAGLATDPLPRATGDLVVEVVTDPKQFVMDLMRQAGIEPKDD